MRKEKKQTSVQLDLFGQPFEELKPKPKTEVVALQFEGANVRMIEINGEPWWVAADVCRVLGYEHTPSAMRSLKDKHKAVHNLHSPSGVQKSTIVSEAGLYDLMMKSRRQEAIAFKDWVVEEVLPAIRKHGVYSVKPKSTRADRIKKRLNCSDEVAHYREKAIDANKAFNSAIAKAGGKRRTFRNAHNASYKGAYDMTAQELRDKVGLPSHRSPMDAMGIGPLSQLAHAKWLASERLKANADKGINDDDYDVIEKTTRHVVESDMRYLRTFGDYVHGIVDDPQRGKIIDVVRRAIA